MDLVTRNLGGVIVMRLSGNVALYDTGRLSDELVAAARSATSHMILDMSGVEHFSRAAARGPIIAAKLMQLNRHELRICGAKPATLHLLQDLGFSHLLKFDRTLESALIDLFGGSAKDDRPKPRFRPRLVEALS